MVLGLHVKYVAVMTLEQSKAYSNINVINMACTFRHNPTMIDSIIHCLIKADNSTKNKCAAKDIISCNP